MGEGGGRGGWSGEEWGVFLNSPCLQYHLDYLQICSTVIINIITIIYIIIIVNIIITNSIVTIIISSLS